MVTIDLMSMLIVLCIDRTAREFNLSYSHECDQLIDLPLTWMPSFAEFDLHLVLLLTYHHLLCFYDYYSIVTFYFWYKIIIIITFSGFLWGILINIMAGSWICYLLFMTKYNDHCGCILSTDVGIAMC